MDPLGALPWSGRSLVGCACQEAAGLMGPEGGVDAVAGQEFVVGTALADAALVENDQLVHSFDRREAVGDARLVSEPA